MALCAVLLVTLASCAHGPAAGEHDGVHYYPATAADLEALSRAFSAAYGVCPVNVIATSALFAIQESSGVSWAVAAVRPGPQCAPADVSPSRTIPPDEAGPFLYFPTPKAVFEELPGGMWEEQSTVSIPWPCPPGPGEGFGAGLSTVPAAVLAAWHIRYASGCAQERQGLPSQD